VWDRTYGSLLQYNRRRSYSYVDSLMWLSVCICNFLWTWGC
jgi:hypothetical protein